MGLLVGLVIFGLIVSVGAGILLFGIVVVFKLADQAAVRIQHTAYQWFPGLQPAAPPKPVIAGSPLWGIGTCLLPSTVVLAAFIGLSGGAERQWIRWREWRIESPTFKLTANSPAAYAEVAQSNLQRPEWIKAGDSIKGDVQQKILASHLWSSQAEAEQELLNQASMLLQNDFRKRHHDWLDPHSDRFLQTSRIAESITKARHVETTDHNFGTFTAPMYQVWWKVEISPQIRTDLYPEWKSAVLQNRIIFIGVAIALVTLFASGVDLFWKLPRMMNRGFARRLAVCTAPVICWSILELLLAIQLMS